MECLISRNREACPRLDVGVFSGGAGAGLIRAFLELCVFSPGVASVLSDGRMAGLVSPAFRDRLAVSIN